MSAPPEPRRRPAALATASRRLLAVAVASLIALAGLTGTVLAFSGSAANQGNEIRAASDWVAPTVQRSIVQKAEGGIPGFVRQGGSFRVFAQVSDTGNPASGVASVRAEISGRSDIALTAGSFSVGTLTYNQRSAAEPTGNPVAAGAYPYAIGMTDAAANTSTQAGFSATVDNTAPTGTNVETANRAFGSSGRPEQGDSVTFSFSELIDPISIIAGWDGSGSQNIVVRINNNVAAAGGNDVLVAYNAQNTAILPLGQVNLGRSDYALSNMTFGASGTASALTASGNNFSITLGTGAGSSGLALGNARLVWTPQAAAFDRAGNPASTTAATESGGNDRNF